jgi:hypothetical protein
MEERSEGSLVAVDERDVIVVEAVRCRECELGERGGRNTLHVRVSTRSLRSVLRILTVPVCGSQTSPPLQPPSMHEFGPGFEPKLQSRRAQMRPAFQLLGT